VQLNGAAARLVDPGDLVILLTYADYEESELTRHAPTVVRVDADNHPLEPLRAK
jgi:aspartate 1-decarboxylase